MKYRLDQEELRENTPGQQGPKGPKGPAGSAGPDGPAGPRGPKGEEGDLVSSSVPIRMQVPSANKTDRKLYNVSCHGACHDLMIKLETESGDADLYARENKYPEIEDSDCDRHICTVCRERSADEIDTCNDITTNSSYFYAMVVAHTSHSG